MPQLAKLCKSIDTGVKAYATCLYKDLLALLHYPHILCKRAVDSLKVSSYEMLCIHRQACLQGHCDVGDDEKPDSILLHHQPHPLHNKESTRPCITAKDRNNVPETKHQLRFAA
jgi:hypothetical protein